jgi:hypothetical protein
MIVGVAVTGGLLLLLALSERAGGFLWHDGHAPARHRCEVCDLSFDDAEIVHGVELTCPFGHPVQPVDGGFQWTIALAAGSVTVICACLAALAGGMPP